MTQPPIPSGRIDDLKSMLMRSGPALRLSDDQISYMNTCETKDVVSLLESLRRSNDIYTRDRAFDGLMNLQHLDRPQYLIDLIGRTSDSDARLVYVRNLARFRGSNIRRILIRLLESDPDEDIRFTCASLLGELGDASCLASLRRASIFDEGSDFEGRLISDSCTISMEKIVRKVGSLESIDTWMSHQVYAPLIELVDRIDMIDQDMTIYIQGRSNWNRDSPTVVVLPSDYGDILLSWYDMTYFLEVVFAIDIANKLRNSLKTQLTKDKICDSMIYYAIHGEYMELQ